MGHIRFQQPYAPTGAMRRHTNESVLGIFGRTPSLIKQCYLYFSIDSVKQYQTNWSDIVQHIVVISGGKRWANMQHNPFKSSWILVKVFITQKRVRWVVTKLKYIFCKVSKRWRKVVQTSSYFSRIYEGCESASTNFFFKFCEKLNLYLRK